MKRMSAMEVLPRTSISRTSLALRSSSAATTRWRRSSLLTADLPLALRDAGELKMRKPHAAECRLRGQYNPRQAGARQMPGQVLGLGGGMVGRASPLKRLPQGAAPV